MMLVRAIRGATTVDEDRRDLVLAATEELLRVLMEDNGLDQDDVVSAIFTATPDLTSCFPAEGARRIGWTEVPLMCASEIPVRGALQRCVRVLLHVNTDVPRTEIRHVYLKEAAGLRPDIAEGAR